MKLTDLDAHLGELLKPHLFSKADVAINGIQVGRKTKEVHKVACAVDASMETFHLAKEWGADLLIVHHGLFWGRVEPITDYRYERIKFLCENDIALYASHLPLDAHMELGNNVGLADELGLVDRAPWGSYKGIPIGIRGRLPQALRIEEISQKLFGDDRSTLGRLPFGKTTNETVGIISGGATMEVFQAMEDNIDVFITGESGHTIYHPCLESGINVIFGGHYRTEVWGVARLARWIRENLGLETQYFDHPTGF